MKELTREERNKITSEVIKLVTSDFYNPITELIRGDRSMDDYILGYVAEAEKTLMLWVESNNKRYVRIIHDYTENVNKADYLDIVDYEVDDNLKFINL